jgi:putative DNA primase/helicase
MLRSSSRSTMSAAATNTVRDAVHSGPQAMGLVGEIVLDLGDNRPEEQAIFLNDALAQAAAGRPVLPLHPVQAGRCACGNRLCEEPGQHPIKALVPDGVQAATTDAALIEQWWATHPRAGVGIATGAASGIVALRVDQAAGGGEQLAALENEHGALPATTRSVPERDVQYVLLDHPGEVLAARTELGSGLAVLADGACIFAPAAWVYEDGADGYLWDEGGIGPVAPVPDWLLALLRAAAPEQGAQGPSRRESKSVLGSLPLVIRPAQAGEASPLPGDNSTSQAEPPDGDESVPLHPATTNHGVPLEHVRTWLADAPVDALVPLGWAVDQHGVAKVRSVNPLTGERVLEYVAPTPIVVVSRLKDIDDETESLRLAWVRDGRWQTCTVERVKVANARTLVDLASVGLTVTSRTASDLVQYLAAFEAENIHLLPVLQVSRRLGWQGRAGRRGFLWGRTHLRPQGGRVTVADLDSLTLGTRATDLMAYRGADAGEEQLADGYCSAGSLDGWVRAAAVAAGHPRVILGVYASLAAPLLTVLGAPNFIIDWAYVTSTGKTTTLRLAASCWGNPDERELGAAIGTWDATRVAIERISGVLNGLPLILDDTKRVRQPKQVAQVLYDVANGRGRGRGSVDGLRRVGVWRTILLSTGEAPITSFTDDGGTRARALELWGQPFGRADATTAPLVYQLDLAVREHYGHAGPQVVEFILAHRDNWTVWREEYQRLRLAYAEQAGSNPVAGRLAGYFAILNMAALVTHAALELPWPYQDPLHGLLADLLDGASDADRAAEALRFVVSWARGNQYTFWGRHEQTGHGEVRSPGQGWAGRWDGGEEWDSIAFLPHRLRPLLADVGFDAEATLRTWHDRGWLETSGDRQRHQKKVRLDRVNTWAVVIRRAAIEEVEGE